MSEQANSSPSLTSLEEFGTELSSSSVIERFHSERVGEIGHEQARTIAEGLQQSSKLFAVLDLDLCRSGNIGDLEAGEACHLSAII